MYVVGRAHRDRFLASRGALGREQFKTVADYAGYIKDRVEIVDPREVVPALGG